MEGYGPDLELEAVLDVEPALFHTIDPVPPTG
jgi:hypothetical protein